MLLRIQIIATGEFLVLGSGTLPLEINSTLFNDQDVFLGSYSYEFTCLIKPNRAALRNNHLILTGQSDAPMVRLWLNNLPWKTARLEYVPENENFNCTAYIDASLYVATLKSQMLNQPPQYGDINDQVTFASATDYRTYLAATTTASPGTYPMVFYPYVNAGAYNTIDPASYADYPTINFPVNIYMNAWQVDEMGNGSFIVDDGASFKQTQTPSFTLAYVVKRVIRAMGLTYAGKVLDEEIANRIVIHSMIPIAGWIAIYDFYNYMPAISYADFLKAVRTEFGWLIDINDHDKICTVESLENLEKNAEVIDLRKYQLNTYRATQTNSQAYTITRAADDKDAMYAADRKASLPVLQIGDPVTAVQSTPVALLSVATMMQNERSPAFPSLSVWRLPFISQPIMGAAPLDAISSIDSTSAYDFKLRFLYYHGHVPDDSHLYTYPFASSNNLDKDLRALTNFNLDIDAADNEVQPTRDYYQFQQASKPFEMDFEMKPNIMAGIKANYRYLVSDFNQAPVYAIMQQLTTDLGDKQDLFVKLTLWPKIYQPTLTTGTTGAGSPTTPPENGVVFARLEIRNVRAFVVGENPKHLTGAGHWGDIWITTWTSAAATTHKAVTGLVIRYSSVEDVTYNGVNSPGATEFLNDAITSTGEVKIAINKTIDSTDPPDTGNPIIFGYEYALLLSAFYTIIT